MVKALITDYFRQLERPEIVVEHYDNIFKDSPEISAGQFDESWEFLPHS